MYVLHPFRISFSSNISPQNLTSETAAYLTTKRPSYAVLAARIAISTLHKETTKNFSQLIKDLYNYGSCHRSSFLVCEASRELGCSEPEEWQGSGYDLERDVPHRSG
jgi:hypothetical protein